MYCKHCGKQIADDSRFCQHCGGKIDVVLESSKNDSETDCSDTLKADTVKKQSNNNFFVRYRLYVVLYSVWVIINLLLFLQGESHVREETKEYFSSGFSVDSHTFKASDVFYPFTSTGYRTSKAFNVKYYDATEFLVYCLLLPLIIYVVIIVRNRSLSEKIVEESKPKLVDSEQEKYTMPTSEIVQSENDAEKKIVFEPSEVKETSTATEEESLIVVDFVLGAIKIVGTILISFTVFVIALMYLRNIIWGCLLSVSAAILTYLLIRWNRDKQESESEESKDSKSPLYYLGLIIFTLFLLFLCYKFAEFKILKSINSTEVNAIDNTEKGNIEEKPNAKNNNKQRNNAYYDYYRDRNKDLLNYDSEMDKINKQVKQLKKQIRELPSEEEYIYP